MGILRHRIRIADSMACSYQQIAEVKNDLTSPITNEDIAQGEDIDWDDGKEFWNEYKLKDGSTLKVKLVLKGVKRLKKSLPDGNPFYVIMSENVLRVLDVPESLKAKPKESTFKPV